MHHNEGIINDQSQANVSSAVSVDNSNLSSQHYSHQQTQHMGMIANQIPKTDSIDYNIHRVNDSSMYNQMVNLNLFLKNF